MPTTTRLITTTADDVTIRRAHSGDAAALARLAALDSGLRPAGGALVAEISGNVVAALDLDAGTVLADPFTPTAQLVTARPAKKAARKPSPSSICPASGMTPRTTLARHGARTVPVAGWRATRALRPRHRRRGA